MLNVRDYIESLLASHKDNMAMADFKEELCGNLSERIKHLQEKGMTENGAFDKAVQELGDITEIADQLSEEKRKEVISTMYMNKSYLGRKHLIGYLAAAGLLAFGIIAAVLAGSSSGAIAGIGTMVPFGVTPAFMFTFLLLTQETAYSFPMPWKRALIYALSVAVIVFGFVAFAIVTVHSGVFRAVATLIPFVLPGSIVLTGLILSQKSRSKPWVAEQKAQWTEKYGTNTGSRYGFYSAALWICALALFITLGIGVGFTYAWLVFLFALAVQLLIKGTLLPKR